MNSKITEQEKAFYKRNVEFFISKLDFQKGTWDSENVEIDIEPDLKISNLKIKGVSQELTKEIAISVHKALIGLISNFEEFKKGSVNKTQLAQDLEISLMDYIQYVLKNTK